MYNESVVCFSDIWMDDDDDDDDDIYNSLVTNINTHIVNYFIYF